MHFGIGKLHQHIRGKRPEHPQNKPDKEEFKKRYDLFVTMFGIMGPIMTLPQLFQIIETQSSESLSAPTWIFYIFSCIVWLGYGILHKEMPIVIIKILYLILYIAIVAAIFMYR